MLAIGADAPQFNYLTQNSNSPVLIHFFPKAGTSTCNMELSKINDLTKMFPNSDMKVVAVSCDTQLDLDALKSSQEFQFDFVSDEDRSISRAYEALNQSFDVSDRTSYLVVNNKITWVTNNQNGRAIMPEYGRLFKGYRP